MKTAVAICILTALLAASHCSAATYWVAPSGDDASPGTKAGPFRTIQHAVSAAERGDTVLVRAGRYEEHVVVPTEKFGEPGEWLTSSAAPGDERKVVVGTETPRVDAYGSQSSAFALRQVQYVRIRGFHCVAPYRGRGSGIGAGESQHIEILNCVVTGGGQGGVDANHSDYVTIDGVEAYFNGGGSGWSSGISLLDQKTTENVVRNCVCYGNYDNSSYRSDGNGIIIDNAYDHGGALLVNNLCFMNGGKGICSTRSDNCIFLNNTSVANYWQSNQQRTAHELSVRGAHNVVRNNIGISPLPGGVGMQALLTYSGPKGRVDIDPATITCDHNLFFNPLGPECVVLAGGRRQVLSLDALREAMPRWTDGILSVDPGFVDMARLDFRLRPDSPALKAGAALPEVPSDLLGKPRPKTGACSLGCYEGPFTGRPASDPAPGVEIAQGEDTRSIQALLSNEYDLDWHGMLWGWGKLLCEELPLVIDVRGRRKADFLNLSGRFVLKDLLDQIARDHEVSLVIRRPDDCKGLPTDPHTISSVLAIRGGADAAERAFVRRQLRAGLWTDDGDGKILLTDQLPALSASLGLVIESRPAIPADTKLPMVTRNMRLSSALTDIARRFGVRLTLSRKDYLADAQQVPLDQPFGGEDGIVELTVERPDGRGRIDIFARVQPEATLCARVAEDNSRFISPLGLDHTGYSPMYHKAATRMDAGGVVRLAVLGNGCALNVGNEWVLLNAVPPDHERGPFHVRLVSDWIKIGPVTYAPL